MKKEEILQKAQLEKDDELITHINNKALFIIVILTVTLAAFTAIRKMLIGEPTSEYFVISNAPLASGFLFRLLKTKQKFNLVMFIINLTLTALGIAGMAMGI